MWGVLHGPHARWYDGYQIAGLGPQSPLGGAGRIPSGDKGASAMGQ